MSPEAIKARREAMTSAERVGCRVVIDLSGAAVIRTIWVRNIGPDLGLMTELVTEKIARDLALKQARAMIRPGGSPRLRRREPRRGLTPGRKVASFPLRPKIDSRNERLRGLWSAGRAEGHRSSSLVCSEECRRERRRQLQRDRRRETREARSAPPDLGDHADEQRRL